MGPLAHHSTTASFPPSEQIIPQPPVLPKHLGDFRCWLYLSWAPRVWRFVVVRAREQKSA